MTQLYILNNHTKGIPPLIPSHMAITMIIVFYVF